MELMLKGRTRRGIGPAIARKLGERGADVAVNYVTRDGDAQDVVDRLHAMGRRAFAMRADVSRLDQLGGLFDGVAAQWQGLDIYVNNAIAGASVGPLPGLAGHS